MNKIIIRNRFDDSVIFEHECENNTIKLTVEKAVIIGANLGDANLKCKLGDANLGYANLRDANLRGANLGGANLIEANLREANLIDADWREEDSAEEQCIDGN